MAAVAGLSVTAGRARAAGLGVEAAKFQVFTAETLAADVKALEATPGNNNLVTAKDFAVVLTTEVAKSATEYEWHEGRDHVVQIVDGETVYEVGGKPQGARSTGAGEWKSSGVEGATTLTLKKGDMLMIPRGTMHRRSTKGRVTFILISPGVVAG